ncbi:MAG: Rieske 2Fe-2S domain-containing protein, partial [Acidimicrobiaceae bacterium]|nr:Rieske 2Fe-2S domain-containing protein [Acidimicrobiaceae bacterium]
MTTIPVTGDTDWALSKNQNPADLRVNRMDVEAETRIYRALRHFWHPVIYSDELDDEPKQVWLCDEQLVAVRLDGEAAVFNDMCAHRGTALSLGKVVVSECGETLQCPYHGWRYAPDGRCVLAPQRPDLAGRLRARIKRHNVVERYGMVWVCLADEPHFPLPEFPQFEDPSYDCVAVPSTDWDHTFAVRRTENYIDPAHLAFVHDGYLGDSRQPA